MFPDERKGKIVELLKLQNRVTVLELTDKLSASEATIRRDLQELEQNGLLKRTHGGAILYLPSNAEPSFNEKEVANLEEKKFIARIAASLINDGDVIILDSGTTTIQMLPFITQKRITAITNSIATAYAVSSYENINLIMIGGQHRNITKSLVGSYANKMIKSLHADKAFIGINAFDFEFGFSTPNIDEAETKSTMIASADKNFIVADYSKFNKTSMVRFAMLEDVDYVITDKKTPVDVIDRLKKEGVNAVNGNDS